MVLAEVLFGGWTAVSTAVLPLSWVSSLQGRASLEWGKEMVFGKGLLERELGRGRTAGMEELGNMVLCGM